MRSLHKTFKISTSILYLWCYNNPCINVHSIWQRAYCGQLACQWRTLAALQRDIQRDAAWSSRLTRFTHTHTHTQGLIQCPLLRLFGFTVKDFSPVHVRTVGQKNGYAYPSNPTHPKNRQLSIKSVIWLKLIICVCYYYWWSFCPLCLIGN